MLDSMRLLAAVVVVVSSTDQLSAAAVSGASCPHGCASEFRPPQRAPAGAKNVLFFAVDDLRPEMEIFGGVPGTPMPNIHSPHINALAAKSLVLTKNYVQQAVCSPTRQSLLTGRRPDRTRVYDLYSNFRDVGANFTTIPQWFRMHGYSAIGIGKIFHPGHASGQGDGTPLGDDVCCSWSNTDFYYHAPNQLYWTTKDGHSGNMGRSWMAVDPAAEAAHPLPDMQIANHAVATLRRLRKQRDAGEKRPFFLAVGFHKPHLPFVVAERYFEYIPEAAIEMPGNQLPPVGMPPVAWSNYGELRNFADQAALNNSGRPGAVLPRDDVLALRRAYYAAIAQTDDMIGRVMAALEETGEADNTVVSFWGDHGWQLGEHGEWCKHTNFEFATRAPMMVHVPSMTDEGIIISQYTEHVDLFPTLTEAAAGIRLPPCPRGDASFQVAACTEGSSLLPFISNPTRPIKTASFSQYPRGYVPEEGSPLSALVEGGFSTSSCILKHGSCTMGYTLVTTLNGHEYRYTEWADFNTPGHRLRVNWDRVVGVELYNHSADPGENFNLNATSTSEVVVAVCLELSKQLRAGPDAARVTYTDDSEAAVMLV